MSLEGGAGEKLNQLLADAGQALLAPETTARFEAYLGILIRWNARTNLTSIRDEDGILRRHFLESIICARAVPERVGNLLDLGSGAGFPGIPIALCRPEISVTLAESQGKKAAFLREAGRVLGKPFVVHAGRAETLPGGFDCVTLRAVDRMNEAVGAAARLLSSGGWLLPFTTTMGGEGVRSAAEESRQGIRWVDLVALPGGNGRILLRGQVS
jgi:16S rRNA (guanine527-N7)-methyltransferase